MRRTVLDINDLYTRGGIYEYSGGFNFNAVWALSAGILIALLGLVVPMLAVLYHYAWFVGFLVSGSVYYVLTTRKGQRAWQWQKQESSAQIS